MNISEVKHFSTLKPGSTIYLSDEESLLESKKQGRGFTPLACTVERVTIINEERNLMKWILIRAIANIPLLILVKIVDTAIDYRVYFPVPEIEPATREANLGREFFWMFKEPANKDDFKIGDLAYNSEIRNGDIVYNIKGQGELNGLATEYPARKGVTDLLGTVVEYRTATATKNPELLIVELGNKYNANGGEITFYYGINVQPNEIDVLAI